MSRPVSYREVLGSLWPLLKREPLLQRHASLGDLSFGAFNAFWTALAFYLQSRPEHYEGFAVAVFGLIAIAGVVAALASGRLSDRFGAQLVNGIALAIMVVAFGMMGLAGLSIIWLALGTFLMNAGAQGNHISNQTRIYTLPDELRNRVTSIYMICYFVGGTVGSMAGAQAWQYFGWLGVCAIGVIMSALGLIVLRYFSVNAGRKNLSC